MRGADGGLPADRNARWVVGGMVRSGRSSVRERQISCRAASRKPGLAPYDALTYHPGLGSDVAFVRKGYSPWIALLWRHAIRRENRRDGLPNTERIGATPNASRRPKTP